MVIVTLLPFKSIIKKSNYNISNNNNNNKSNYIISNNNKKKVTIILEIIKQTRINKSKYIGCNSYSLFMLMFG